MKDDIPNYAKYSLEQLYDVAKWVDREKHPDRFALIVAEIAGREKHVPPVEKSPAGPRSREPGLIHYFLYLCFGLFLFDTGFLTEAVPLFETRHWVYTPCVIRMSVVSDVPGSVWDRYGEIRYAYRFGNREYVGDRYTLFTPRGRYVYRRGKSESKSNIAVVYPVGTRTFCYVNPDIPGESVLRRGWNIDMWMTLFGTSMIICLGLRRICQKLSRGSPPSAEPSAE